MGGVNCRVFPHPDSRRPYSYAMENPLESSKPSDLCYGNKVLLKWCKELKLTDESFVSSQGDKQE